MFKIPRGTLGKLISLMPNKDAEVKDWITRKELVFTEVLIDPTMISKMDQVDPHDRKPLAVRMALEGYALFGGDTGGDRNAQYVLAIPFAKVTNYVKQRS